MVDYFTYTERLNTKGDRLELSYFQLLSNKSIFEKKPYIQKILSYLNKKHPSYSEYKIWLYVYNIYFSSINIYKPSNAIEIYNKYKPKSILDFTMGWGGRLIGACALNIPQYIGVDLNQNLKEPYDNMIEMLHPLTETKIKLFFMNALEVDYSKIEYDMVFTSPPYYNKEIYEGTKRLSKLEWDEQFYIPIFEKTYKHLKKGDNIF